MLRATVSREALQQRPQPNNDGRTMATLQPFFAYDPTRGTALFLYITLLILALLLSAKPCPAAQGSGPFFLMGSGRLHLKNMHNAAEARVELLNRDGLLNDAAFTEVDRVFGFPTEEKGEHISPRLLFMLSYFADLAAPGKTIRLESGYRSPDYNDMIRQKGANAARTSTHMDGMALDFSIDGIDGKALWEKIRAMHCCGVGHYGGASVHLDAGRPRFWQAATSGTMSNEPDYNRHIYLSTDLDRYAAGAKVRLSLSGISTFGFGIKPAAGIYDAADAERPVGHLQIADGKPSDCLTVNDRKASRFLYATLPAELPAGRYRIKLQFCRKPFAQMPAEVMSAAIELAKK